MSPDDAPRVRARIGRSDERVVQSEDPSRAARAARDATFRKRVAEPRTLAREAIEVRRSCVGVAIATELQPKIIGDQQQDVFAPARWPRGELAMSRRRPSGEDRATQSDWFGILSLVAWASRPCSLKWKRMAEMLMPLNEPKLHASA